MYGLERRGYYCTTDSEREVDACNGYVSSLLHIGNVHQRYETYFSDFACQLAVCLSCWDNVLAVSIITQDNQYI